MILKVFLNVLIMIVGSGIIILTSELFFQGVNNLMNKYKKTKNEDYFFKYIKFNRFFFSFALGAIWFLLSFFYAGRLNTVKHCDLFICF